MQEGVRHKSQSVNVPDQNLVTVRLS